MVNTWWGIIIYERLFLCEVADLGQPLLSILPARDAHLPAEPDTMNHGDILVSTSENVTTLSSLDSPGIGGFGRAAQATWLLDQVLEKIQISDIDVRLDQLTTMDRTLQSFLTAVMQQHQERLGMYCGGIAISIRALFILHLNIFSHSEQAENTRFKSLEVSSLAALDTVTKMVIDIASSHEDFNPNLIFTLPPSYTYIIRASLEYIHSNPHLKDDPLFQRGAIQLQSSLSQYNRHWGVNETLAWQPSVLRCFTRVAGARFYSAARSPSAYFEETVDVPVGGNGHLSLSILHPASLPQSSRPNVILYLPPGPLFQQDESDTYGRNGDDLPENALDIDSASAQHVLASTTLSTVVTVNYRLGGKPLQPEHASPAEPQIPDPPALRLYKYPVPIHDTLAGFDWVLQNLRPAQLCVYGQHVGGSLALMLALTEPRSILAVAAYEPVCDWVSLDDYCLRMQDKDDSNVAAGDNAGGNSDGTELGQRVSRKRTRARGRATAPRDLIPLLAARARFFQKPEKYFDAFASPILFLRSPGKEVPLKPPKYLTGPEYPVPVSVQPKEDKDMIDFWDIYMPVKEDSSGSPSTSGSEISGSEIDPADGMRPVRRRKALSRWPPYGLDYGLSADSWMSPTLRRSQVTLPWVRIYVPGEDATEAEEVILDFESLDIGDEPGTEQRGRRPRRHRGKPTFDNTVLESQAAEMVSVMHRACFFGREKGFGQNRVKLIRVPAQGISTLDESLSPGCATKTAQEETGRWLSGMLNTAM
ncbi:conserved hypothetical protein [Paecilomyces variotii No. 5]|uniref:Alpha/beta hydrolase fold-3 domain-containing protein n=1 Tax=Byssochlamys spectabilis (strain No. 5 / NBRC 109023) TaxID=1356009 RepID=V5HVG2_BYSSN|nr:conserved hypothetical protein [Paecilomyces variotii No. 5]